MVNKSGFDNPLEGIDPIMEQAFSQTEELVQDEPVEVEEPVTETPSPNKFSKLSDSLDRVSDKEISKMEKEEEKELDEAKKEEKQALYNDLKNDMVEFEELQRNIMNNMKS